MRKTNIVSRLHTLNGALQDDLEVVNHDYRELLGKLSPLLRGPVYKIIDRIDRAIRLAEKDKLKNI